MLVFNIELLYQTIDFLMKDLKLFTLACALLAKAQQNIDR